MRTFGNSFGMRVWYDGGAGAGGLATIPSGDGKKPAGEGDEGKGKAVSKKALNRAIANLTQSFETKIDARFGKVEGTLDTLLTKINNGLVTPPAGEPAKGNKGEPALDPNTNAKLVGLENSNKELTATVKALKDANDAAVAREKQLRLEGALRTELGKFSFVKPEGLEAAFRLMLQDVQQDDKGNLIANNLPLTDYVKTELTTKHDYWLAPVSGATGTGATRQVYRGQGQGTQIENIKAGMNDQEYAAAAQEISSVLKAYNG